MDFDVVVVGAGISGLSAALKLLAENSRLKVAVLEAQDRVGGRTLSVKVGQVNADLGGQWLGHSQHRAKELAAELGVFTYPQYCEGIKIMDMTGCMSTYSGDIPLGAGIPSLLETQFLMWHLEALCKTVSTDNPHRHPDAQHFDGMSCYSWLENHVYCTATRQLVTAMIRGIFGVEPHDLSFLHFLVYLNSGGGPESLVNIRKGAQESTFLGGAQQISQRMAEKLGALGCEVFFNSPVDRILQCSSNAEDGVSSLSSANPPASSVSISDALDVDFPVRIQVRDGRLFRCHAAILAMAPAISARIDFWPRLSPAREQLHQRNFIGSIIKTLIVYSTPFWRSAGFSGEVVCDCHEGPVFNVYDDCIPITGTDDIQPMLVVFCNGNPARNWALHSPASRRVAVLRQLVKWFGACAEFPLEYVEKNWVEDEWSRGCPIGNWPTGALWAAGHALRTPCQRIFWAGTETATQHQGFIDGAITAGERAAVEVNRFLVSGHHLALISDLRLPVAQRLRNLSFVVFYLSSVVAFIAAFFGLSWLYYSRLSRVF